MICVGLGILIVTAICLLYQNLRLHSPLPYFILHDALFLFIYSPTLVKHWELVQYIVLTL
jgi:hypothetical protein